MATQKTDLSNATQDFQALSIDHTKISKAAFLRAHYEEIESAIKSGVKIKYIISVFKKHNIDISTTTFNQYIYRERQKRPKEKIHPLSNKDKTITKPLTKEDKSDEMPEPGTEPVKEWKSAYSKNDPRMIDEILRNPTDLDALAKEYREFKKKLKNENRES